MATLLWPGDTFRVSGLEMIKGVRWAGVDAAMSYLDELVVPIIENTPKEEDLRDSMAQAMKDYPKAAAVLVRRHGVYVWGELFSFCYVSCPSPSLNDLAQARLGNRRKPRQRCVSFYDRELDGF